MTRIITANNTIVKVELIEKELVKVNFIEKEIVRVELKAVDILRGAGKIDTLILNENPTKISSKRFQTLNSYTSGSLQVYLNGIKEKYITEIDSNKFEFEIDTIEEDTIEISYIKDIY